MEGPQNLLYITTRYPTLFHIPLPAQKRWKLFSPFLGHIVALIKFDFIIPLQNSLFSLANKTKTNSMQITAESCGEQQK